MYAIYVIMGLYVGFVSGLFGIGGGLIVVPVLAYLFQYLEVPESINYQTAVGTSLTAMIFTSLSSAVSHYFQNGINFKVIGILLPGLILGIVSGAFIANYIPGHILKWFFASFVFILGLKFIFQPHVDWHTKLPLWVLAPISYVIGLISTILGIGGGLMTVPVLTTFRLHMSEAVSTSAITGFIIATFGTLSFFLIGSHYEDSSDLVGYIYMPAALSIGLTAGLMAPFGAMLAYKLHVNDLKKYFGLQLLFVAFLMLLKT